MSIRYHDQIVAGPGGISSAELEKVLSTKQDKLTGAAGRVVGFDASGAAAAVQGWSNLNLLDNWYFADPVNQRRGTVYNASATHIYTIDRLVAVNLNVQATESGLLISPGEHRADGWIDFRLDGDWIYEKTITLSALVDNKLHTFTVTFPSKLADSQYSVYADGLQLYVTRTAAYPVAGIIFEGKDNYLAQAAKLELGTQQTLAHQDVDGNWVLNDPPPNKALELAKCQKYCINLVHEARADDFVCVGSGLASETDLVPVFIPLPVPLRAAPSIAFTGDWRLVKDRYWEQGVPVAYISPAYLSGNGITLWVRCAANSIEIGKNYYLCGNGSSEKSLLLSSDL